MFSETHEGYGWIRGTRTNGLTCIRARKITGETELFMTYDAALEWLKG